MNPTTPIRLTRFGWKATMLALTGLLGTLANAPAQVWTNDNSGAASGLWSTAANWSPNTVPNAVDAIADFGTLSIGVNSIITNDAPVTVGTLLFSRPTANATAWTLHGPGGNVITLYKSSGIPTIGVTNSQVLIGGLTGTNGFEKTGNGALAIYGFGYGNNITGDIHVRSGLLASTRASAFSPDISGDIYVYDGASFSANAGFEGPTYFNNFYISGSGGTASGYIDNAAVLEDPIFNVYRGTPQPVGALDIVYNGNVGGTITLMSDARITHGWNDGDISGNVVVTNAGQNLEVAITANGQGRLLISGSIYLGTGSLTISGAAGTAPVTLNAVSNNYAGGTIINGGSLVLTAGFPESMDTTGGLTFTTGGRLDRNGNSVSLPSLSGFGGIITDNDLIGSGTTVVTINQSSATFFGGSFQDGTQHPLSVVKNGTGSLTLGGLSTHTGGTTFNAGRILGASGGGLVNSGLTVPSGATNGYIATVPNGQWSCTGLVYQAGTTYLQYDFGGQLVDPAYISPLLVNGDVGINGTLNVSVTNGTWVSTGTYRLLTYTGSLTLSPTINLTGLPAGVTATLNNNIGLKQIELVVTAIPPYVPAGSFDGVFTNQLNAASTVADRTWSVANNWLNGVVASGASATANFSTLGFTNNVSVTNDVPRNIGKLLIANTNINFNNGANARTFTLFGAVNKLTLASTNSDTPVIQVNSNMAHVGALGGSAGFIKTGNGYLSIVGDSVNSMSGPITVSQGVLGAASSAAWSGISGTITVQAGAAFNYAANFAGNLTNDIILNGTGMNTYPAGYVNNSPTPNGYVHQGTVLPLGALDMNGNAVWNGNITLNTDSRISHSWNNATINGNITGANRNLELRHNAGAFGGQPDLVINGSINLGSGSVTVIGTGAGANRRGATLANAANSYSGGTFLLAGRLRMGDANALSGGALTVNGGFVDMRDLGSLNISSLSGVGGTTIGSSLTTAGTSTINLNQSSDTTFSGSIDNNGDRLLTLTKAGTGSLTLAGTNNYSGDTLVNGGQLMGVTGGSSSNSLHTIADGATNGVKLATAGGQWVCGPLTYASGGSQSLAADFGFITPSTTTAPLLVNGAVAFDGTVTVRISGQFVGTGSYPLVTATGGITGSPAGVVLPPAMTGNVQVIGDTVWLNVLTNTNTPPAQPTILPVYNDGLGNIVIRTVTELNHNYLLQSATNLNSPIVWVTLSSTLGTGGTITSTVPVTTTPPNQFFRYLAQ